MFERGLTHTRLVVLALVLLSTLAGCSSMARTWRSEQAAGVELETVAPAGSDDTGSAASVRAVSEDAGATLTPSVAEVAAPSAVEPVVRLGTGQFVNPDDARRYRVTTTQAGDIVLNFEEAELRRVVKMILGDLLGETYYMDPTVKGTVTVQNDNSLRRDQLVPILEELLQMNGAALVKAPAGYRVVPLDQA